MKLTTVLPAVTFGALVAYSCSSSLGKAQYTAPQNMLIRLSELEIEPRYLAEYTTILREESAASVRLEPGVIAIYPMQQQAAPQQIRILEIYASQEAYQAHLKTPHFQKYKASTLPMVKALRLIDMQAIDPATMPVVFKKLQR
jgi:quinol monooxygenase YgiN